MKRVIFIFLLLINSGFCGTVYIIKQDVSIKRKVKSYIEFKNEGMVRQEFDYSCGSSSLATILKYFFNEKITEKEVLDWVLDKKGLIDKNCKDSKKEKCKIKKLEELEEEDFKLSFFDLAKFAKEKGYKAVALALNLDELRKLKVPAIAFVKIRRNEHFTVYKGMDKKFVYLADPSFGNIKVRIGKARSAFIRLGNIWKKTAFSKKTKIKLFNNCVLSVLLYGSECWRMTDKDINRLSSFHNTSLRQIMKIF